MSTPACGAISIACAASSIACARSDFVATMSVQPKPRSQQKIAASMAVCAARAASIPKITYPEELPISANRDEIRRAIEAHPVVIVCGETGSGKTTQLPKICLEAGRGVAGIIGHTQPRRIAARAVASRIAEELGTPLGQLVGYKLRFQDRSRPRGAHQAHDGRHPARRNAGRSLPRRLRHDHRRRGARALAQHRLPAGLSQVAAAEAAGSARSSSPPRRSIRSASRGTSTMRRSSTSRAAAIRSRCATARSSSTRKMTRRRPTSRTPFSARSTSCGASRRATSSCS